MKTLPIIQNQLDALLDFEVNLKGVRVNLRLILEEKNNLPSAIAKINDINF